jgi:hypothetical protein
VGGVEGVSAAGGKGGVEGIMTLARKKGKEQSQEQS